MHVKVVNYSEVKNYPWDFYVCRILDCKVPLVRKSSPILQGFYAYQIQI